MTTHTILRLPAVKTHTGLSRSTIYLLAVRENARPRLEGRAMRAYENIRGKACASAGLIATAFRRSQTITSRSSATFDSTQAAGQRRAASSMKTEPRV